MPYHIDRVKSVLKDHPWRHQHWPLIEEGCLMGKGGGANDSRMAPLTDTNSGLLTQGVQK